MTRLFLYAATSVAAAGVVVLLARRISASRRGGLHVALPALAIYGILVAWRPGEILLSSGFVVLAGAALASLIGPRLRSVLALISFLVAAAIADLLSFFSGPTRRIADEYHGSPTDLLPWLAVTLPTADGLVPVVGLGDLAVLGILSLALSTGGTSATVSFAVPVAGLLAALVVGFLGSGAPAIPFMAAAVLALLGLESRLKR